MSFPMRLALVSILLGLAHPAAALELGEYLGDPELGGRMTVDIPILGPVPRPEELRAEVPGHLEHRRLGETEAIGPEPLRAEVLRRADGQAVVRVWSDRDVHEPALRFRVRLRWPGGERLREYELLLDPPAYAPRPASRIAAPAPPAPAPARIARTAPPVASGQRYGPVRSGETLFAIVDRLFPEGDAAVTASHIVALNPRAFVAGDPNRLLRGASLALPTGARLASPAPVAASPARSPRPGTSPATTGQRYGPVRAGETLYAIARRVSGAPESRIAAVARALHAANPDAFVDNDMNRLKVGAILRTGAPARASSPPGAPASSRAAAATPSTAPTSPRAPTSMSSLATEIRALRETLDRQEQRTEALTARLERSMSTLQDLRQRQSALTQRIARTNAILEQTTRAGAAGTAPPPTIAAREPRKAPSRPAAPVSAATAPPAEDGDVVSQVLATLTSSGRVVPAGIGLLVALLLALVVQKLRRRRQRNAAIRSPAEERARVAAIRQRLAPQTGPTATPEVDDPGAGSQDEELEFEAVDPMNLDARSDPGDTHQNVTLTDAARANDLAKRAALSLAYEDYAMARRYIDQAIALEPHRDEHRMVLLTLLESTGDHAAAEALVTELIARREQLEGPVRAQVEQLSQRRQQRSG